MEFIQSDRTKNFIQDVQSLVDTSVVASYKEIAKQLMWHNNALSLVMKGKRNVPADIYKRFTEIYKREKVAEEVKENPDFNSRESLVRSIENLTANELRLTSVIEQMMALLRDQFNSGRAPQDHGPHFQPGTNVDPAHPMQHVDLLGKSKKAGK